MRTTRTFGAAALAALFLALAVARPAMAWGFYGHVAIADEAASRLGFTPEERAWYVLGSLMGDLDKSDFQIGGSTGSGPLGSLLAWLARLGASYTFPALVDQHDPAYAATLCERAAQTGDPRLIAWSLGVLIHGVSDRFTDGYARPDFRVSSAGAEISVDLKVFVMRSRWNAFTHLRRIETQDEIVFGANASPPITWWLFGTARALKRGEERDAAVRRADPFAEVIRDAHTRTYGTAPGTVSDVCRQQLAMDAFTWNYRLKAVFFPGWRQFAQTHGDVWYDEVERIASDELVPVVMRTTREWQAYLASVRAGAVATRPAIP